MSKNSLPEIGKITTFQIDGLAILGNMMFRGARNIDGRGFDTEENRPTNLQIPMIKK